MNLAVGCVPVRLMKKVSARRGTIAAVTAYYGVATLVGLLLPVAVLGRLVEMGRRLARRSWNPVSMLGAGGRAAMKGRVGDLERGDS